MNEEDLQQAQRAGMLGQTAAQAPASTAQNIMIEEQEKGLAEAQLDVEEIIDHIHNLLLGKQLLMDDDGVKRWKEPDKKDKTLSEWGVHRIMQTVRFHINRNTLLSNFNEEQINRLMLSFVVEMNDLMLLKYEKLFRKLTFEECVEILEQRYEERAKKKVFAAKLLGKELSQEETEQDLLKEIEGRIEFEIERIRRNDRREKIKEYGLLMEELEAQVYATYNRAWKGEERGSLRRHTSFSEIFTPSGASERQRKGGLFGWRRN